MTMEEDDNHGKVEVAKAKEKEKGRAKERARARAREPIRASEELLTIAALCQDFVDLLQH